MRVPYSWLREYCDPGVGARELAERLAMTGTEVERVGAVGPPAAEGFVIGRVLECERHPNADRLSVCTVDTGEGEARTIVCGAPNVAAGQTVPVALPGATMPGGSKLGKAKLRGVESHGMILSAAELEIAEESEGILVLDDGARAWRVPCRGAAAGRAGAGAGGDAEPGRLLRRLRRGARGARDQRRAARSRALGRGRPGRWGGRGQRLRLGHGRGARALPPLHRPGLHRRDDRALAGLAAGAAERRRAAADQQRRRHHQLRDAADRAAAARLRPRQGPRRGADRARCRRGGEDDDARRRRAQPRRGDRARLRPQRSLRDRRDHGRSGLRGLRPRRRGCCSRWPTGTAPTSCAPRACSACARRPPRASRSSSTRSSACGRSGSPRG